MEKNTVTIEIRQEVSITLLWIVAGVILVSAATFLTPVTTDLWPAANVAGIVAFAYLVALLINTLRKPVRRRMQLAVGLAATITFAAIAYQWIRMEDRTHWQKELLMQIRGVIGRGICTMEMTGPLLKTLDLYHRQGANKTMTLADAFAKIRPGARPGSNIHKPEWEGDETTVIVTVMSPDSIVLVSRDFAALGRDRQFKNFDGATGMVQEQYTLTARGMSHVSEN
ncbi:MAG TPA: hypothetical protein VMH23_16915 [Bacteroidota bacterium]|nr:hypothetical protein [Bacteroidota bacterium]